MRRTKAKLWIQSPIIYTPMEYLQQSHYKYNQDRDQSIHYLEATSKCYQCDHATTHASNLSKQEKPVHNVLFVQSYTPVVKNSLCQPQGNIGLPCS